jgi:hypothetical protein
MNQLQKLKKQVFSQKDTAKKLKRALFTICRQSTTGNTRYIIFPKKLHVKEVICESSQKIEDVTEFMEIVYSIFLDIEYANKRTVIAQTVADCANNGPILTF